MGGWEVFCKKVQNTKLDRGKYPVGDGTKKMVY
jgi:hypothetical protein